MRIILPNERPPSWNIFYASSHWMIRKQKALEVHMLVFAALRSQGITKDHMFKQKVDIDLVAYFKNRPLDSDNIPVKFYIDGLKGILIEEDSPKFVGRASSTSLIDSTNPRVEIDIAPSIFV